MHVFQRLFLLILIASLLPALSFAQTPTPQADNSHLFAPLQWPAPNDQRTAMGAPGPQYWQQSASYDIAVTLDPATHTVSGTVQITYTNNSPHSLPYLWLQLDQNAFSPTSKNARLQNDNSRWKGAFEQGGYTITDVSVSRNAKHNAPDFVVDDTRLKISLDNPLPANGAVIDITIDYSYMVPELGADRTGRLEVERGTVYQIAQWYPRIFVFDDISGWNTSPYLGQGEFYTEYGDYNFEITAPSDFVVVATGELLNPEEVFTASQVKRLEEARGSERTTAIIKPGEVGKKKTRPRDSDTLTWQYRAQNVRDIAWAASQAFILDGAGWNDVLILSAYPHESVGNSDNPGWERSTEYVRHSVAFYSDWYPYPYPVAINVAGPVGGMEYPMIVFCDFEARGESLFGVTDHEFGHTWFPMIVGSNERQHAWMDEGFTTFINYFSNLDFYGPNGKRLERYAPERTAGRMQEPIAEQPSLLPVDQINPSAHGFLSYRKPAIGLLLLRNYILTPERFDPAFKAYINQWAYKHPQPADFFRTIEQATGENLAWFWRGWFYGTDPLDQEISVRETGDSYLLTIQHNSDLLLPVDLKIDYADGSSSSRRIPIEAFFRHDQLTISLSTDSPISQITIDPNGVLPDINRNNNAWGQ